jgi:hypothetical protein
MAAVMDAVIAWAMAARRRPSLGLCLSVDGEGILSVAGLGVTAVISASSLFMGRPRPWAMMVIPAQPVLDDVALGLGVQAPPRRVLGAEDRVGVRLAQSPDLAAAAGHLLPAHSGQSAHLAGPSR